jgi:antitoxin component of MazEF toxin-antitoxin module
MKIQIRRIGNSLGVLLPKATLEAWGMSEGDSLELTDLGLRPPRKGGLRHQELDELRRTMALAVVRSFTPAQIRAQILANLHRWKLQDAWVSAFDEWQDIAQAGNDGRLFSAMLGRDEDSVRLRQSAPYAGLLPNSEVRRLNEEAAG